MSLLIGVLLAWIIFDLLAWRWGVDSSDGRAAYRPYRWEQQRGWRDI